MILRYEKEGMPFIRTANGIEDWDGADVKVIEYEPDQRDLEEALVDIIANIYFSKEISSNHELKKGLKNLLQDLDLGEKEIRSLYYDDLKEYFEQEAEEEEM